MQFPKISFVIVRFLMFFYSYEKETQSHLKVSNAKFINVLKKS